MFELTTTHYDCDHGLRGIETCPLYKTQLIEKCKNCKSKEVSKVGRCSQCPIPLIKLGKIKPPIE
jgi:hypothetical protein